MRYHIVHTTTYHYDRPVRLNPHTIRLRPRCDGTQWLQQFAIAVQPSPQQQADTLDAAGNSNVRLWFGEAPVETLHIRTESTVETRRTNPFDYLSEPWAIKAPMDYPQSLAAQLAPYLAPAQLTALSPAAVDLAQTLLHQEHGNLGWFLTRLTQTLYERNQYVLRLEGDPQPAGVTLARRSGSCRDLTMVFMEACQAIGLAARFVSGYQEGDLTQTNHDLHAWPEVFVPGGGWRGFDPTLGLAVSDRHIALAAAAHPLDAAPVTGALQPGQRAETQLKYDLQINSAVEGQQSQPQSQSQFQSQSQH